MAVTSPANSTMVQLNEARTLALNNANFYPTIVPGILPIVGLQSPLEQQRWGADFLAETFATPMLAPEHKQQLSVLVVSTLKELLEVDDTWVVKSAIQAASSLYPFIFKQVIDNPSDPQTWKTMDAIKKNVLRRTDTAPAGVKICCIKFIQRVIQTQTPGLIADPRRPEQNEISLALVPRDHPLIPPPNLEAEASGLLDRLLGILQENSSDALLVTATLNSLGSLIRTRAAVGNKVISTVMNFNPLKLANAPMTPTSKVLIKSMERTTRALLINIIKRNPQHPLAPRINEYLTRLHQARTDVFDENNRKRSAPVEPTDGLDPAKRQRLGAEVPRSGQTPIPPLPPGPTTYAQLYTLTQNQGADVSVIPFDVVSRILVPLIQSVDQGQWDNAINAVRSRYLSLSKPRSALDAAVAVTDQPLPGDDDEDYEPDYEPAEDAEQVANRLNNMPPEDISPQPPALAIGPYKVPQPPPLTQDETDECSRSAVTRMFGFMSSLDGANPGKPQRAGFNRLAGSNYDRDAWLTLLVRLAARTPAGLENGTVKTEGQVSRKNAFIISDAIREALFKYVMDDFRRRINVAVSWLNEEWYNDRVVSEQQEQQNGDATPTMHYTKWLFRLMDSMLPFLEGSDRKLLLPFLSEIPEITTQVLDKVKALAKDPERVGLAVSGLQYLVMLRPPVREISLDAIEDLWRNYDGAKPSTEKLLKKYRPEVLEQANGGDVEQPVKDE